MTFPQTDDSAKREQGPSSLTILSTYRCTAACKECCFESSPKIKGGIPPEHILQYIEDAAGAFSTTLKVVVFSGGECFLLGKNLDAAIAKAKSHDLRVRCVTNGFWASTPERANRRMAELAASGLTELNISTGDEHQQFVPYSRVVNGAIAAATNGIRALIVVEGSENAKFTSEDARQEPRLATFKNSDPSGKNIEIKNNIWMPFHSDNDIKQSDGVRDKVWGTSSVPPACTNILRNVVITPHEQLASCCGLTFEHIPEMKLGSLRNRSMSEMYDSQFNDFLKIWIALDGPHKIWQWAHSIDPSIKLDEQVVHICHACAIIHQDSGIRRILSEHYQEKVGDVMLRFQLQERLAVNSARIAEGVPEMAFGW